MTRDVFFLRQPAPACGVLREYEVVVIPVLNGKVERDVWVPKPILEDRLRHHGHHCDGVQAHIGILGRHRALRA